MSDQKQNQTKAEKFASLIATMEGLKYLPKKSTGGWLSVHTTTGNGHRVCVKKLKGDTIVMRTTVDVQIPGKSRPITDNGSIKWEHAGLTVEEFESILLPRLVSQSDTKAPPRRQAGAPVVAQAAVTQAPIEGLSDDELEYEGAEG